MNKISVILAFYKRIDYLKLVLAGFERQSYKNFEIIISDDGSESGIIREIELLSRNYDFKLFHLWHQDKGFRKNKILNEAITFTSTDYLIFIDGDCIPHKEFVKEHYENKKDNVCLTGRRVNLSEEISRKLNPAKIKQGYLENPLHLIQDGLIGESYDVEKGFYTKSNFLRRQLNKKKRGILGCNFSLHKKDILKINGFDERYEAPSVGEDSDIQYRLELENIYIKSVNNIAIQYHLYHKIQPRLQENLDLFERIKNQGLSFTPFGIIQ